MTEEWRVVSKAPLYEVSNLSRIRRIDSGHVLRPRLDRYGYLKLTLIRTGQKRWYATVHRVVALAWVNGFRPGWQVNHIDGNKENNLPKNLEWISGKENIIHSFENRLNSNSNPVGLHDILIDESTSFRSIKDLSRRIGISSNTLIPLIRNSFSYPILGRYIVSLDCEIEILDRANTVNFGKEVFVYDHYSETMVKYPSLRIVSYFTGIKSSIFVDSDVLPSKLGYTISLEKFVPKKSDLSKQQILKARIAYLSIPYVRQDRTYSLYDYYSREELHFDTLDSVEDYINSTDPVREVRRSEIHEALNCTKKRKNKRTGLLRGFGIRSSTHDYSWYPYPEEVILRSKYCEQKYKAYRVTYSHSEKIIFGFEELCEYLGYPLGDITKYTTLKKVLESIDNPNLSVVRLCKPIT